MENCIDEVKDAITTAKYTCCKAHGYTENNWQG